MGGAAPSFPDAWSGCLTAGGNRVTWLSQRVPTKAGGEGAVLVGSWASRSPSLIPLSSRCRHGCPCSQCHAGTCMMV